MNAHRVPPTPRVVRFLSLGMAALLAVCLGVGAVRLTAQAPVPGNYDLNGSPPMVGPGGNVPGGLGGPGFPGSEEEIPSDDVDARADPTSPWNQVRDIFKPPYVEEEIVPVSSEPVEVVATPTDEIQPPVPEEVPQGPGADGGGVVLPEINVRLPMLQGIMVSSDRDRVAILDGEFLRPGDFVGGFTVRKISKTTVVLKRDGKEYVLYVKQ